MRKTPVRVDLCRLRGAGRSCYGSTIILRRTVVTDTATISGRLVSVTLDAASIGQISREVDHERQVAIFDLLEQNSFEPVGAPGGEFSLRLSLVSNRLVLQIFRGDGEPVTTHILSLTPFRRIIRDYYLVCDSYYEAIKVSTPSQIEAIDMGRRALHDEGAQILSDKLSDKILIDKLTARRLFTLIAGLRWKG
ncbi:hypothetical protein CXZ10_11390 [Pleomorphomonas diazotrophica]|uniref:Uncharacterized protein n=1 Tax=Pleomorphomonas diazotrophica TaxID=1166257 RepID=A0A2N3LWV2_9HYPH|nr:hypothetical protein CXZ10_11390 [Pleomorphomonas diazotrophica]